MKRIMVAGLVLLCGIALAHTPAHALTYTITVQNDIPGGAATGQPMTPPVGIVHDNTYSVFMLGSPATSALEVLAEEGVPTDLAAEATAASGVSNVAIGGGPFVDKVQFEVEGDPGDLFSLVTMLARTNDLITGVRDVALPATGSVQVPMTNVYDAGTETNTGLVADIPFYGNTFVGPEENGVVSMISSYAVTDDPAGKLSYQFPPSATVTIEVTMTVPVEAVSWGAIKREVD